jgi:hypothetical protein
MKTKLLPFIALLFGLHFCGNTPAFADGFESIPPVVVRTVPEAGTADVQPGEYTIKVTFSKTMADRSWSWTDVWQGSTPKIVEQPHYEADGRTCVIKVTLEPGHTYGWWLNSQKFQGFRDAQGQPAVPYLLTFQTKAGAN